VTYLPSQSDDLALSASYATANTSALRVAQEIYTSYCQTHPQPRQPSGVAVDLDSYRGQLIFRSKPVLLPDECFVPFSEIEVTEVAEAYPESPS
jgi:hypothetical protein